MSELGGIIGAIFSIFILIYIAVILSGTLLQISTFATIIFVVAVLIILTRLIFNM